LLGVSSFLIQGLGWEFSVAISILNTNSYEEMNHQNVISALDDVEITSSSVSKKGGFCGGKSEKWREMGLNRQQTEEPKTRSIHYLGR
jgi:hypothetical protein